MKRKRYSRKFQRMAVERMRTCENVGELARELGVRTRFLYKWRAKLEAIEPAEKAARVPLHSVSEKQVVPGAKWRVNLYRIDGLGADPVRHFMCWQPTCVIDRDPNHVPEHFGTLIFAK